MRQGFFRVASVSTPVTVADPQTNANHIISSFKTLAQENVDMAVFPEMSVPAYTCGDLFHNQELLDGVNEAIARICQESTRAPETLIIVGAPMVYRNSLYNCAVCICNGSIDAVVPKTYIPNYNEFYEKRWFSSAEEQVCEYDFGFGKVEFGPNTLLCHNGVKIGVEICEDLWTPIPPSSKLAMQGAEIIANLSASDDITGKYAYLTKLVEQQSARCICAYAYSSAGFGESSTDLVFDAKLFIAENGHMLARNQRWQSGEQIVIADVDIEAIRRDRMHNGSFEACRRNYETEIKIVNTNPAQSFNTGDFKLKRTVDPHPFIPSDEAILGDRCEEIVNIQVAALAKRLDATHTSKLVVGVSGGLDSTLALLIAARTFDRLGLDRKGIIGVTMPGFGTTGRTHSNACTLMSALGISQREISIVEAVNQHFSDIGHDCKVHDVTYENSQARERTQILMDIANQVGGMVLGTGDLSELALGWATYNGDHMSMYAVNAGVPKTLVKYLTRYFAENADPEQKTALLDIIDTPISPELLPATAEGEIDQKTEDLVGPYELHDFFLYYTLRYGFKPSRIFILAQNAFAGSYDNGTIHKWLRTFFRRFFNQQFKRSCLPDGPKVGSVCLSPRGDWRMPSDASSALWLADIDRIKI